MQGAWRRLAADDCERFALVWETKELIALNWSLTQFALNLVSCGFVILEFSAQGSGCNWAWAGHPLVVALTWSTHAGCRA